MDWMHLLLRTWSIEERAKSENFKRFSKNSQIKDKISKIFRLKIIMQWFLMLWNNTFDLILIIFEFNWKCHRFYRLASVFNEADKEKLTTFYIVEQAWKYSSTNFERLEKYSFQTVFQTDFKWWILILKRLPLLTYNPNLLRSIHDYFK